MIDLERHQREEMRWRILRILDSGRPYPVGEQLIYRVICDVQLPASPQQIRRELDYLRDKGLVELTTENRPDWQAALTGKGVDVVEYSVDSPAGITRPPRSFE